MLELASTQIARAVHFTIVRTSKATRGQCLDHLFISFNFIWSTCKPLVFLSFVHYYRWWLLILLSLPMRKYSLSSLCKSQTNPRKSINLLYELLIWECQSQTMYHKDFMQVKKICLLNGYITCLGQIILALMRGIIWLWCVYLTKWPQLTLL